MTNHPYEELIRELSNLCGIIPEYWDIFGKKHTTSPETVKGILRAMQCRIKSEEDIVHEIQMRKWKTWREFIDPVNVISVNEQPVAIPVYIPIKEGEEKSIRISWCMENEENPISLIDLLKEKTDTLCDQTMQTVSVDQLAVSEEQWIDGKRYLKALLTLQERYEIGYYRMTVRCTHPDKIFPGATNAIRKKARIILAPDACYTPDEFTGKKTWGLFVSLYAIRSHRNWEVGDFTDLKNIVTWVAGLQGGFVGINPLHAIPNTKPFGISPYSPISRLYKNYLYLDLEQIVTGLQSEELRESIAFQNIRDALQKLRQNTYIDYEAVAELKVKILRHCFDFFYKVHYEGNTHFGQKFRKYISGEGDPLESFALYMALWEHMKQKGKYTWQEWPAEYHEVEGGGVRDFRVNYERDVLFYKYIQWLIDQQMESIEEEAKSRGMLIGLYQDLAIGSIGGGSDAWSNRNAFAYDAEVGAPPDDFSPDGQTWGFPPLIPEKQQETGYSLFVQTIRKNMKRAGALRIDHALGMFRMFWVPKGMYPKDGAYVSYPYEDLIRIIALESVRNKTVVIAEDLGTMGDNVRETLKRFQMLSYRLLYFERNYPDPSFLSPDKYPALALCSVTTHDLPTISGYWKGRDLEVSRKAGKYPDEVLFKKRIEERERDKQLLTSALKSLGVLRKDFLADNAMTPELCRAIYAFLFLTPCRMMQVSFDDILGALDQQNLPGTLDTHPNWVQKTLVTLEDAMEDSRFSDLAAILKEKIFSPEGSPL
jgi:4-alpha-glucanotransferase